jgi:L-lactate dehydrogenase complex protein LldG
MSNREAFLARVRQAAEQGRQYRVHLKPFDDRIGYLGAGDDLVERFASEVNAVGGQAFVVPNIEAARRQLKELLIEARATSALCWQHDLLNRLQIGGLLSACSIVLHDYDRLSDIPAAERRTTLLACDVGITSCDCAIAETGTLTMCSHPGHERVASLLPATHIAIVEQPQIIPDLIDAIGILNQRGVESLPSNVTFITGPSKTGDIELQLTTGVHGPGKWLVIVIAARNNGGSLSEIAVSRAK